MKYEFYVPGSHPKAEKILQSVAHEHGCSIEILTDRLRVVRMKRRKVVGVIGICGSSDGAPSPISSRGIGWNLEPMREQMCDALVAAKILQLATKDAR